MKNPITTRLTGLLSVALITGWLLPAAMPAQFQPAGTAKGGAARHMRPPPSVTLTPGTAVVVPAMACANCKDVAVTVPDIRFKGTNTKTIHAGSTKTEMRHLCAPCQTSWKYSGHGKQKVRIAMHACGSCL